jgi:anti-sigma B factor antagonist
MQREPIRIDEHGIRPPRAFSISDEAVEGAVVIALEGELDLAAAEPLRNHVDSTTGSALVLDLRLVTFVDSSALRELLRAHAALRDAGGELVLAGVGPAVARLFELTRTTGMLSLAPSVDEALRRLGASA